MGPGRPPLRPTIIGVRELRLEELQSPKGRLAPIKRFRDSHHLMARLFASGLRPSEVAAHTGYSISRVSIFYNNPAFQALVEEKRQIVEEVFRDRISAYNDMILMNGIKAERKVADKLDDDDENETLSVRELIAISRDAADRVGLSKRSIQTNVNLDFASMLDKALKRSRPELPRSGDLLLSASPSEPPKAPDRGPSSQPLGAVPPGRRGRRRL